ncbi:M20 family metallopeptidase [Streptomyces ipomoeae]|uniref:M20 family metallopeptidase n=1 Tax=Streptomyces ipomoeae TaxID=103232 RepID=UPI001147675F|nr:M20/M25/M40 family metallo-hydrolase [Streptomyces ipomoeae]MDX2937638.1 M20/M25/M40 family metallo-hydrolase [Streptomyces ipomoeae]TQE22801.1 M20 family peptidase [Streptomyces ipomoeae]
MTFVAELTSRLIRCHPQYRGAGVGAALDLLADQFGALGFETELRSIDGDRLRSSPLYCDVTRWGGIFAGYGFDGVAQLVATRDFASGGPHVLLNGHIDTEFVDDEHQWSSPGLWRSGELRGERIYGRGASDMLGGVSGIVAALRRLVEHPGLAGRVTVHIVVDEEIGGNGTLALLLDMEAAAVDGRAVDVALIAEPTAGYVCASTSGFQQYRIRCHGNPCHMVYARDGDNALTQAAHALLALDEADATLRRRHPLLPGSRYLLAGKLHGGTDAAIPAASAEIELTAALPPWIAESDALATVEEHLARRCTAAGLAIPRVEPYGLSFPGSGAVSHGGAAVSYGEAGDGRSALVRALLDADGDLRAGHFPSACDARLYEHFGIPAIVFGPGDLARAHGPDEYVTLAELEQFSDSLGSALIGTLGRAS